MGTEQNIPWFRELYDTLLAYRGPHVSWDVLQPWLPKAKLAVSDMDRFRHPFDPQEKGDDWVYARWNLYALGRVIDLLLLRLQSQTNKDRLSLEQYNEFFSGVGFAVVMQDAFSPFHHEIVEVLQSADEGESVGIVEHVWPGLMLGDLLVSRSGVRVSGGTKFVVKEVAERSMLHYAHRRLTRRTTDQSVGWGSNSQWRTSPRFDYRHEGRLIYNFCGQTDLLADGQRDHGHDDLTIGERIELCKNRCLITSRSDDSDLYPYVYRLVEKEEVPIEIDPRWLTSVVRDLAHSVQREKAFDRLPVLADALEEAGCQNEAILGHCRTTNGHGPRCWVVELLLERSAK